MRTVRGSLARASLRLGVLPLPTPEARLGWLTSHLGELPGSGIVYALTVAAAEDAAALLREAGHEVRAYTGRTDPADRLDLESRLRDNDVKALVATSALGMGFDKPDLGFVVHLGAPASPVAYYQQVGRAGRATERADVLLLPAPEDREIWHYFATASMPRRADADAVLAALDEATQPMSTAALETVAAVRRTRLELLLKVLDVEGAVRRAPGGWTSTGAGWTYDEDRYARVAAVREREAAAMVAFQQTEGCRMRFLQDELDDPGAGDCGRCDRCAGQWFDPDVPPGAAAAAGRALRRVGVAVEPRSQWPAAMERLGVGLTGRIPLDERVAEGRAIARLTDLGWGQRLRSLLRPDAGDAAADAELLTACVEVLAAWSWDERPVAVVGVPSQSRPLLVASIARHLAEVGRLAYLGQLDLVARAPVGEPGGNSAFRLAGVHDRFGMPATLEATLPALGGPVLLVDDLIDSRWTVTVAGRLLRRAGATAVLPFAAALAA